MQASFADDPYSFMTYLGTQNDKTGLNEDRNKAVYEQVQKMTPDDLAAFQRKWLKDRSYTYSIFPGVLFLSGTILYI